MPESMGGIRAAGPGHDPLATGHGAVPAGHGSLTVVLGEPGTGRSRLLRRFAEAATDGAHVLRAEANLLERDVAFGVLHQAFHPLVTAATEDQSRVWFAGAAAACRPVLTGDPAAGPDDEGVIQQAVRSLLANLGDTADTLLIIDDLQWADGPSLRCLRYLARRLTDARVLIVVALAEQETPETAAPLDQVVRAADRVLRTSPLDLSGTARLLSEQFGVPSDTAFTQACDEVCAGNPALLVALARALRSRGVRPVGARAAEVHAVGPAALLERRMFLLGVQPPEVRDLARAAAILDTAAEPGLVRDLAGLDDTDYHLAVRALDRLGLLDRREPPRLVDATVRRAVESAMTIEARELMYGRAAALLYEAGFPVGVVAENLLMVMSGTEPWQADVLREAAAAALDRSDGPTAARFLRHALLDSVPGSVDRARLLIDLAAAERGFDLGSAVRHLSQAVPVLPSAPQRAAAATWIPVGAAVTDEHLAGLIGRAATGLAAEAGPPDPGAGHGDLVLQLEARTRRLGLHDPERLADAVGRLRELGPDLPLDRPAGRELLAVLLYAATVTAALPATEVAMLARQVLDRQTTSPDHAWTTLPLLIPALLAAGATAPAERWLDAVRLRARQDCPAGRRLGGAGTLLDAEWSAVLLASARPARAAALALEALRDADPAWTDATVSALWALTLIALGTRDPELGEQVLATIATGDDLRVTAARQMIRGLIRMTVDDPAGALGRFLDSGRQLARCGLANTVLFPWRAWAAPLAWHLGDRDTATVLAGAEQAFAAQWGSPVAVGRALRLRAVLADGEEQLGLLRRSAAVLRDSTDLLELSRTLTLWARALASSGSGAATEVLSESRSAAAACGVVWLDEEPEDRLFGPVFRMVGSQRSELSRAEDAVVALAFEELTNQQIADRLGITRRAVEKSLTSMYRKLRVSGRPALLAALTTAGGSEALGGT